MKRWLWSAMIVLAAMLPIHQSSGQKKVVGYYPSWSKSSYPHTAIQYQHLTHIAHAFIFPYANGSIDYSPFTSYPELITTAHQKGVKVVICVGGWDDVRTPNYAAMAADTSARRKFVDNLLQFMVANGYDGADLDWEYPKTAADRSNLSSLVHQLRLAFDATGNKLSLSMAVPATSWSGQWFDVATMSADFDWIGMMTYDFYGAWTSKAGPNAALYGNFSTNSEGWIDYSFGYYNSTRGVPKEKLLVGVPFYGQAFNASAMYGTSTSASQQSFTVIAPKVGAGWTRYWDSDGQVPYLINAAGTQVISYDDTQSVALKCAYVSTKGAGGVIIWALGQDQYQGRVPLLSTVGLSLHSMSVEQVPASSKMPVTCTLEQYAKKKKKKAP
ncbi:MAG: glycoside hydrolase family 18 protein [Ignavibacteriales bacterium]|nr:glycoside hydrolase family 18 protein [Ignavibacteriales bacterium]